MWVSTKLLQKPRIWAGEINYKESPYYLNRQDEGKEEVQDEKYSGLKGRDIEMVLKGKERNLREWQEPVSDLEGLG